MDIEYGVKTENKFSIVNTLDDEALDPSDILKKLASINAKDDKNVQANKKKLQQQKKSVTGISTTKTGQQHQQAAATTGGAANKIDNKLIDGKAKESTDKENKLSGSGSSAASRNAESAQKRFVRGGAAPNSQSPRNRLPRQERSNIPPRFRQPNDGSDQTAAAFQNGGAAQQQQFGGNFGNRGAFGQNDEEPRINETGMENSTAVGQPGFGTGFGGGFNVDDGVKDPGYRARVFGRGGRRFNNGPRERGGYNRGRQFDRQSGSDKTGVKPIDKREGSGAHNWGSANRTDDLIAEGAGEQEADVSAGNEEMTQKAENYQQNGGEFEQTDEQQQQQEEAEPEPVQLTLDEWKALQEPRSKPAFNVRRAGEGEKEKSEWKKLVPLKGGDEAGKKKKKSTKKEELVVDEDEEEEDYEEAQKIVPIDINFIGDSHRGGRGRGRGGGGRGSFGGGRGFGRGMDGGRGGGMTRDRGTTDVPYKIDDETFPSLK